MDLFSVRNFFLFTFLIFLVSSNSSKDLEIEVSLKNNEVDVQLVLQHVTIVVNNIERSRKFYIEILNLEDKKIPWLPENQMFLSAGNGLELHVGEVEGVEINPSEFNHFALTPSNFQGFLNHLKDHGIEYGLMGSFKNFEIQKRADGVHQTFLKDPDGYIIEINHYPNP